MSLDALYRGAAEKHGKFHDPQASRNITAACPAACRFRIVVGSALGPKASLQYS